MDSFEQLALQYESERDAFIRSYQQRYRKPGPYLYNPLWLADAIKDYHNILDQRLFEFMEQWWKSRGYKPTNVNRLNGSFEIEPRQNQP